MNGDIETKEFDESFVAAETKESSQIVGVIFRGVDGGEFSLTKDIAVNATGNVGQFSNAKRHDEHRITWKDILHTDP